MAVLPLVLDTDLGSDVDDVLALGVVLGSPELRLDAVTTVYGDTRLRARLTRYALDRYTLDRSGVDVPVAAGRADPLSGAEVWWAGLEGALVPDLDRVALDETLDAQVLLTAATTVLAVGPLTNLALALRDPGHRIGHAVVMGGSFGPGPEEREHNIGSDVVAAAEVVDAGVPVTMIGLDQTTRVRLGAADVAAVDHGEFGRFVAAEVRAFWAFFDRVDNVPHDPLAALVLTDPELFGFATGTITVTPEGITRFTPGAGPHRVVTDLDPERARAAVVERLVVAAGGR